MEPDLEDLDREVARLRDLSLEDSTKRSYSSHHTSYLRFCQRYNLNPVPVDQQQVAGYIAYLSQRLAPSSIPKYLNMVRIMHLEQGFPDPAVLHMFQVKQVLTGVNKEKCTMG